jgi:hypothetical protein
MAANFHISIIFLKTHKVVIFNYFILKWRNNGFEQKHAAVLDNKVTLLSIKSNAGPGNCFLDLVL